MAIFATLFTTLHKAEVPRRSEIDWEDIVGVLRAAKQNIDDPEFRAIVECYGGSEAIHEIKRRLARF